MLTLFHLKLPLPFDIVSFLNAKYRESVKSVSTVSTPPIMLYSAPFAVVEPVPPLAIVCTPAFTALEPS